MTWASSRSARASVVVVAHRRAELRRRRSPLSFGPRRLLAAVRTPMTDLPRHEPVLLEDVVRLLVPSAPRAGFVALDLTVGLAGHAEALLRALPADARLIGIDRDPAALALARRRLEPFGNRAVLVHGRFSETERVLREHGAGRADLVLADLGVSSLQLDDPARGFSFRTPAALDMRMDPASGESAADLLDRASEEEIAQVLADLGEEPRARRIARALARGPAPRTTEELRARVAGAVGHPRRHHDPATLTFQALRIAVNRELEELDGLLLTLPGCLAPGARVGILAYHSLEDRRVKEAFRRWTASCTCPPELPVCVCGGQAKALRLTRGAHRPGPAEIERNPRSRSARLRAMEWAGDR